MTFLFASAQVISLFIVRSIGMGWVEIVTKEEIIYEQLNNLFKNNFIIYSFYILLNSPTLQFRHMFA